MLIIVEATSCDHCDNVIIQLLRPNNANSSFKSIKFILLLLSFGKCYQFMLIIVEQGTRDTLNTVKVKCLV
jgi:hypothetical protein